MIARMNDASRARVGVEAGRAQLVRLRDLDPVDELHRHDPLAGQLVVDVRDVDLGEARHAVRQPPGVVRLVAVVELLEDAARRTRRRSPGAPTLRAIASRRSATPASSCDDAEVGLGLGHDPRPLDLDRDERPVVERRPVDLGGRRRGERLGLDRREQLLRRRAELLRSMIARRPPRRTARRRSGASTARRSSPAAARRPGWPSSGRSSRRSGPSCWSMQPDPRRAVGVLDERPPRRGRACANQRRNRPTGVSVERDVEARRVDRVVDLLEPQVLDDQVAARRRQRLEEPPDRGRRPVRRRSGPVEPEHRVGDGRQERVQGRGDDEPQQDRAGRRRRSSGASSEAIHRTIALMTTTNRPIVESSSRPVNATRTGPDEAVDQDEDQRPRRGTPTTPGAPQLEDRRRVRSRTGTAARPWGC